MYDSKIIIKQIHEELVIEKFRSSDECATKIFFISFAWLPGLVLAFFGHFWIVGPLTLLVLPLTAISYGILYWYQKKRVFDILNLRVRKNKGGFVLYLVCYQMIMSPVSVWGYAQELFQLRRSWK